MKNVIKLSNSNDIILKQINEYKKEYDYKCNEGYINEVGIVLGINGKSINVSKSYSNMKGIGFKEKLLEYNIDSCVTNIDNNTDKYILGGNPSMNKISFVINIDTGNYYKEMIEICNDYNIGINVLMNSVFLEENIDYFKNYNSILYKGNNDKDINRFIDLSKNNNIEKIICVKTNDYDVLKICNDENINSIIMLNQIEKNLLYNIKHSLNKGDIVFIKENEFNLNELRASIKYINSKGIDIVKIEDLVF